MAKSQVLKNALRFQICILFIVQFAALPFSFAEPVSEHDVVKPETPPAVSTGETLSGARKRTTLPRPQDDARAQAVLRNLVEKAGWFPNITVTVDQGMVTIAGTAKDAEHLKWLAETADRIPSVLAVINQAAVEKPPVSDFTPAMNEFKSLIEAAKKQLPLISIAILLGAAFLFGGRLINRGITRLWQRRISNPFLLSTVSRLTMLPLWILLFYMVLQVAGLSSLAATIIGGTGAMGIVLGFAFKDIAENYISGLILSVRSPFTKGDEVVIDKYEGYVQSLSMRGTTITDYDGTLVLIPNRIVLQSVIKNLTISPQARVVLTFDIGLNDSVSQARKLVLELLQKNQAVLKDPGPALTALALTKTAVTIRLAFWYDGSKVSKFGTISDVVEGVQETLLRDGFSLMTEVRQYAAPVESDVPPRAAPAASTRNESSSQANASHDRDAFRINQNTPPIHRRSDDNLLEN